MERYETQCNATKRDVTPEKKIPLSPLTEQGVQPAEEAAASNMTVTDRFVEQRAAFEGDWVSLWGRAMWHEPSRTSS